MSNVDRKSITSVPMTHSKFRRTFAANANNRTFPLNIISRPTLERQNLLDLYDILFIDCPIPKENFKTDLSRNEYRQGFPIGSKIYFYCRDGFILRGRKASSECLADGWSPEPPTCVPKGKKLV